MFNLRLQVISVKNNGQELMLFLPKSVCRLCGQCVTTAWKPLAGNSPTIYRLLTTSGHLNITRSLPLGEGNPRTSWHEGSVIECTGFKHRILVLGSHIGFLHWAPSLCSITGLHHWAPARPVRIKTPEIVYSLALSIWRLIKTNAKNISNFFCSQKESGLNGKAVRQISQNN